MNFKKFVWGPGVLDQHSKSAIALSAALFFQAGELVDLICRRKEELGWSDQTIADIAAVTSTCAMYNAYFKFKDLLGSDPFQGMSVGLRAHTFTQTSLSEPTVELINIAISDLNGCKPCTTGHVMKCRELGIKDESIQECIQIASAISAGGIFLRTAKS